MKPRLTPTRLARLSVLLILLFGAYFLFRSLDLSEALHPERISSYLDSIGFLGPFAFMLIMAIAVVISPIPSLPLDLAAGASFGPLLGTIYAVLGAEIGAIISFLIGRALGRDAVTKIFRMHVVFCEKCSDRHLFLLILLARLLPIFSFDIISYGAGLTNMSLKVFGLATLLGMTPPTFVLTYFGKSIASNQWSVIVLGAVLVGIFLLLPQIFLKYRFSWLRPFLQGEPSTHPDTPPIQAVPDTEPGHKCSTCGKPMD